MTTTSTRHAEIHADPDVPLVRITREFDAPPAKVFRAHTDPDLAARWLGPRDHEMRTDHFDSRTGGTSTHPHHARGAHTRRHAPLPTQSPPPPRETLSSPREPPRPRRPHPPFLRRPHRIRLPQLSNRQRKPPYQ